MAKEFFIEIGGRKRRLQFRSREAIALKQRFGKPLLRMLREDVMGLDDDGKIQATTDLEVQAAFIHAGIVHEGRRIQESQVLDWIDEHIASGKAMGELVEPVWKAVFMSGVLGYSLDMDEELKKAEEEQGPSAGGKAETEAAAPAPAIPAADATPVQ